MAVESKQHAREVATRHILAISAEQRIVLDAQIATHISHLPMWSNATAIFGYMALEDEVDLQAVFRAAIRSAKAIGIPRIDPDTRTMTFRRVDDFPAALERHPYGFLQPAADAPTMEADSDTIILVPGRTFDRSGYRVGRGGGFYDAYLTTVPDGCVTVGVGYSLQLTAAVPHDAGDVPVQIVITDNETCFARRSQKT